MWYAGFTLGFQKNSNLLKRNFVGLIHMTSLTYRIMGIRHSYNQRLFDSFKQGHV